MPLTKLQFRPGINRETTQYTNEGGWFDMDKVRFRFDLPEKIGGWVKNTTSSVLGTCRSLFQWNDLTRQLITGIGTNLKFYIMQGGSMYDITPIRSTTTAGEPTFSTAFSTLNGGITASATSITLTSGSGFPPSGLIQIGSEQIRYDNLSGNVLSSLIRGANGTTASPHSTAANVGLATITVMDASHGAIDGDFVTFSGATSLGGNITAAVLNQEYQVASLIDASTYLIEARTVSLIPSITVDGSLHPTYVFSTASDVGNGGASTVGEYQINSGLDAVIFGTGWGAGPWSRGGWGSGADIAIPGAQLRVWSQGNYGEDLVFNARDGGIFYWDATSGTSARGVPVASLPGSQAAPVISRSILISDRDRHVIAFGCDDEFNPGVQDPLLIRWCDQENILDWRSLPTNTAGSLRLSLGSKIVASLKTKQQMLVFTDTSLHVMQYLGPPFTFGINLMADSTSIAGPNAAVSAGDFVFWMGINDFYAYNGVVSQLPCTVRDYVFGDINLPQIEKVFAGVNATFSEVWWFYPSASSDENDRYVVFNYQSNVWYYGTITRTAWLDRGISQYPLAAGSMGYLFNHETGFDDGSTNPVSPIQFLHPVFWHQHRGRG
ncbi:MAG: hypothetical protein QM805_07740 [Pseudomonas sp.]